MELHLHSHYMPSFLLHERVYFYFHRVTDTINSNWRSWWARRHRDMPWRSWWARRHRDMPWRWWARRHRDMPWRSWWARRHRDVPWRSWWASRHRDTPWRSWWASRHRDTLCFQIPVLKQNADPGGHSINGRAGSNPTEGMHVRLFCLLRVV